MIHIMLIERRKNIYFIATEWFLFFTQVCFAPNVVEIDPVVLKKDFLISSMYFRYFVIIIPVGKGYGASFKQTWITFT